MATYKDLNVWKESMNLTLFIYKVTADFPNEEKKGLTDQMRRAAISIPSNIAEGYGRLSDKDLVHFLKFSLGSAYELDTQLEIAKCLNYIDEGIYNQLSTRVDIISKMLNSLIYRRNLGKDTFEHND